MRPEEFLDWVITGMFAILMALGLVVVAVCLIDALLDTIA